MSNGAEMRKNYTIPWHRLTKFRKTVNRYNINKKIGTLTLRQIFHEQLIPRFPSVPREEEV